MPKNTISSGTVHKLPTDLKEALAFDPKARSAWESITALARNEWICWITYVKKQETRNEHVQRTIKELKGGVRRPCCWIGCTHRKDKPISPSVKHILSKRQRTR